MNALPPQGGDHLRNLAAVATGKAVERDLDQWLGDGTRMLARAQEALLKAEHELETGRAKIVADAKLQLATFHHAKDEEIRRLREQITRLTALKEAGAWPTG